MIRTQVYLPEDLYREAMLFVKTQGVKFSHLVREGLGEAVKKRKKRSLQKKGNWKDFIGALTYGPKDLSNHINDIYK